MDEEFRCSFLFESAGLLWICIVAPRYRGLFESRVEQIFFSLSLLSALVLVVIETLMEMDAIYT